MSKTRRQQIAILKDRTDRQLVRKQIEGRSKIHFLDQHPGGAHIAVATAYLRSNSLRV
jgi:hypothetical protein